MPSQRLSARIRGFPEGEKMMAWKQGLWRAEEVIWMWWYGMIDHHEV